MSQLVLGKALRPGGAFALSREDDGLDDRARAFEQTYRPAAKTPGETDHIGIVHVGSGSYWGSPQDITHSTLHASLHEQGQNPGKFYDPNMVHVARRGQQSPFYAEGPGYSARQAGFISPETEAAWNHGMRFGPHPKAPVLLMNTAVDAPLSRQNRMVGMAAKQLVERHGYHPDAPAMQWDGTGRGKHRFGTLGTLAATVAGLEKSLSKAITRGVSWHPENAGKQKLHPDPEHFYAPMKQLHAERNAFWDDMHNYMAGLDEDQLHENLSDPNMMLLGSIAQHKRNADEGWRVPHLLKRAGVDVSPHALAAMDPAELAQRLAGPTHPDRPYHTAEDLAQAQDAARVARKSGDKEAYKEANAQADAIAAHRATENPPIATGLHNTLATSLHNYARHIVHNYGGDPRQIWADKPDRATLEQRLALLPALGDYKKVPMVSDIGERTGLFPRSDQPTMPIIDSHINRLYSRLMTADPEQQDFLNSTSEKRVPFFTKWIQHGIPDATNQHAINWEFARDTCGSNPGSLPCVRAHSPEEAARNCRLYGMCATGHANQGQEMPEGYTSEGIPHKRGFDLAAKKVALYDDNDNPYEFPEPADARQRAAAVKKLDASLPTPGKVDVKDVAARSRKPLVLAKGFFDTDSTPEQRHAERQRRVKDYAAETKRLLSTKQPHQAYPDEVSDLPRAVHRTAPDHAENITARGINPSWARRAEFGDGLMACDQPEGCSGAYGSVPVRLALNFKNPRSGSETELVDQMRRAGVPWRVLGDHASAQRAGDYWRGLGHDGLVYTMEGGSHHGHTHTVVLDPTAAKVIVPRPLQKAGGKGLLPHQIYECDGPGCDHSKQDCVGHFLKGSVITEPIYHYTTREGAHALIEHGVNLGRNRRAVFGKGIYGYTQPLDNESDSGHEGTGDFGVPVAVHARPDRTTVSDHEGGYDCPLGDPSCEGIPHEVADPDAFYVAGNPDNEESSNSFVVGHKPERTRVVVGRKKRTSTLHHFEPAAEEEW